MTATHSAHPLPGELRLRVASGPTALDLETFHRIARLRQEVFVVEQECAYLDLDGRDLEPGTVQVWAESADGEIAAGLRILSESGGADGLRSIGRVVTAPAWRGRGIAGSLLRAAIAECGDAPIQIHAQSYLTEWYAGFGFVANGPEFLEDGIPHTPMLRAPGARPA
ncbi:GNAT family N-acetyltransferase [Leucobacter chromiireducens]|uniref:GNAT family N-acetyltransferase n=1 Tax=Leucobacter chromiireducens TaxID=283877 RepID=UPI000F62C98C|nr:GNAT family N-acetyltransferase [Leucobacter chromiireducens]